MVNDIDHAVLRDAHLRALTRGEVDVALFIRLVDLVDEQYKECESAERAVEKKNEEIEILENKIEDLNDDIAGLKDEIDELKRGQDK